MILRYEWDGHNSSETSETVVDLNQGATIDEVLVKIYSFLRVIGYTDTTIDSRLFVGPSFNHPAGTQIVRPERKSRKKR